MTLSEWQAYNHSCTKTLVFHFGTGAGFFSEYNNMIRMLIYCMIHQIRFTIYSADCSFGKEKGWDDFFIPFTESVTNDIHHRINRRWITKYKRNYYKMLRAIYHSIKFRDFSMMYIDQVPILIRKQICAFYKRKYRFNYVTSDLWFQTWNMSWDEQIYIENVFQGTVKDCFKNVDELIWKYNTNTLYVSETLKNKLFPSPQTLYFGMQIRGGDKYLETDILPYKNYFNVLQRFSAHKYDTRNILVLTDDYSNIENIKKSYPTWNIYSLCDKSEHGYYNEDFVRLDREIKYMKTVALLVQVELLKSSLCFIGTYNSGPGEYLMIVMEPTSFISIN